MFKYHMINTLTMDLLETNMEDFTEHFERQIEQRPYELFHVASASTIAIFDDIPFENLSPKRQRLLRVEGMTIVRIKRTHEGATTRNYLVIANQTALFDLTIERFRHDRLRLTYQESLGPLRNANLLINWLTPRFVNPIYHVNLDLNPILREPPTKIGLTIMETWVAELTAMGVSAARMMNELGLDPKDIERHRRNIAQKAKSHLQITRDLQAGELDELLRGLGHGILGQHADPDYLQRGDVDLARLLLVRSAANERAVHFILDIARSQTSFVMVDNWAELLDDRATLQALTNGVCRLPPLLRAANCGVVFIDEINPPWKRWLWRDGRAELYRQMAVHLELRHEQWLAHNDQISGYRAQAHPPPQPLGRAVGQRHDWPTGVVKMGTHPKALQSAGGWNSPAMVMRYVDESEIANEAVIL